MPAPASATSRLPSGATASLNIGVANSYRRNGVDAGGDHHRKHVAVTVIFSQRIRPYESS